MAGRLFWIQLSAAILVYGCECPVGTQMPCQAFGTSSTVFVGTVQRIIETESTGKEGRPGPERHVIFEAAEAFKGVTSSEIEVVTGMGIGSCGLEFRQGESYLVYAYRFRPTAALETSICARTRPIDRADEDLAFLRKLNSSEPGGTIFGHVSTSLLGGEYARDGGLAGVTITLSSGSVKWKSVTDSKGKYNFSKVQAGKYSIAAEMPKKLGGGTSREISLERQACVEAPFFAKELGSISGVVLDALGRPVHAARIELERASDHVPVRTEHGVTMGGGYRIELIPPGEYLIGFNLTHPPSAGSIEDRYERNYFPGVPSADMARRIKVESAQQISGIDWRIGPPLAARKIQGFVFDSNDEPVSGVYVELRVASYEENAGLAVTTQDGKFHFEALMGVPYTLVASSDRRKGAEARHGHAIPMSGNNSLVMIKLDRPGRDCEDCRRKK